MGVINKCMLSIASFGILVSMAVASESIDAQQNNSSDPMAVQPRQGNEDFSEEKCAATCSYEQCNTFKEGTKSLTEDSKTNAMICAKNCKGAGLMTFNCIVPAFQNACYDKDKKIYKATDNSKRAEFCRHASFTQSAYIQYLYATGYISQDQKYGRQKKIMDSIYQLAIERRAEKLGKKEAYNGFNSQIPANKIPSDDDINNMSMEELKVTIKSLTSKLRG